MKLNTKLRYAIMALCELAKLKYCNNKNNNDEINIITLSKIADNQELSISYLEQLFLKLKKRNILISSRGINGGYKLAKAPELINIYEVMLAIDEPIKMTRCSFESMGCHSNSKKCYTHNLWHGLENVIKDFLSQITLADVVNGKSLVSVVNLEK